MRETLLGQGLRDGSSVRRTRIRLGKIAAAELGGGFSVLYKRASRLFTDLAQARGEGRLPRLMNALERTRLLIIDDWGPEPLNAEQRRDLLEIVDDLAAFGAFVRCGVHALPSGDAQAEFAPDSALEQSGFEPLVPLTCWSAPHRGPAALESSIPEPLPTQMRRRSGPSGTSSPA